MIEIIKRNKKFLDEIEINKEHKEKAKTVIWILNKRKLAIITWMPLVWKTKFIKYLINSCGVEDKTFYFNKGLDLLNKVNSLEKLNELFETYLEQNKQAKIIILQSVNKIPWIKEFIKILYKQNHKIVIVWNSIKIWWENNETEVFSKSIKDLNLYNYKITNLLKYWFLDGTLKIENEEVKKKFLSLSKDKILSDITNTYDIKNSFLFSYTISFLVVNNKAYSLRDIHKEMESLWTKISLITLIEYIDYSITEKLIRRLYKYDLKKEKEIRSKAKYYFSDTWIRNSASNYELDKESLKENLIYNELKKLWCKIYSGINGRFEFSFYAKCDKDLFIHISNEWNKNEIKKLAGKLAKIEKSWDKFLIVNDFKSLNMRNNKFRWVEILEIREFIKLI